MPSKRVDIKYVRTNPSVSFETVASHYGLDLEPNGSDPAQKKTLCPFHDDTDPSLSINLDKRVYKCFPCGSGGNILDFIIQIEELSSNDAPRKAAIMLAEICGVDTVPGQSPRSGHAQKRMTPKERLAARAPGATTDPVEKSESESDSEPVKEPVEKPVKSSEFEPFTRNLELDQEHPYLKERGLNIETIETFEMGYCNKGFMKNRIAIRLHDHEGNPLGYGGRWAESETPEDKARYLLPKKFPKEHVLFNAHRIDTNTGEMVLVESFWSVFRLHANGMNVVSTMGWAISEYHIEILKGLNVERITILFDGDQAGREGTQKALEILAPTFFVRAPAVPDGFKPHSAEDDVLKGLLQS